MLSVNPSIVEIPAILAHGAERRLRDPAVRRALPGTAVPAICAHRVARWAHGEGLGGGDAVALLVRDAADAASLQLGLSRIGVRVARIDTDLRGEALAGTLAASGTVLAVVDAALAESYGGVMGRLETYPAVWWNGPEADIARLDLALAEQDAEPVSPDVAEA